MMYHSLRGIHDGISQFNKRKARVLLFASMERSASTQTFVEARPYIEYATSKGHVGSAAQASEVCDLKPARSSAVDNAAPLCNDVFGALILHERSNTPSHTHNRWIGELTG
jgi:hypothetical protein